MMPCCTLQTRVVRASLAPKPLSQASNPGMQVLHVNDPHAHLDPSDVNIGTTCDLDAGAPTCFGGLARLATALAEAKAEGAAAGMDSLVLHAGDQFTGREDGAGHTCRLHC